MPRRPPHRSLSALGFCAALLLAFGALRPGAGSGLLPSALEPVATGGVEAVDRALAKLSVHQRLLVIGAHPDDEDTALLALVARGLGGEAAYLSLSRGEGGQNLLGPELGVGLGLIRTRELEAARRIDGARQLFTRAYDFGYTRSLEETFRFWPREELLVDAVRAVRRFMPQVIVSVFPPDERGGHGQHQAAGVIAEEAYRRAADAFPPLDAEGLPPWRPEALYHEAWWDPEAATLEVSLGRLDPWAGKSIHQLAMASRSMHRSQDMGVLQEPGPRARGLAWVAGGPGPAADDPFAGVDKRLAAIADLLPEGEARTHAAAALEEVERRAREARSRLAPTELGAVAPELASLARRLGALEEALAGGGTDAASARALVAEKRRAAEEGLLAAAGVAVEALADRELVALGEEVGVTAQVWNAGGAAVELVAVGLRARDGWSPAASPEPPPLGPVAPGALASGRLAARGPAERPTVPYFLEQPLTGPGEALYDWSAAPAAVRGEPFGPPPLAVAFELAVAGVPVRVEREVVFRHRDQELGEVRRPVRAVPPVEVEVAPALVVGPAGDLAGRRVEVALVSRAAAPVAGQVALSGPEGWLSRREVPFTFGAAGERRVVELELVPPPSAAPGRHRIAAEAVLDGGARSTGAVRVIDYPHIRPAPLPAPAAAAVAALDLVLPALDRVGFVTGVSDRVPELLRAAGFPIEELGAPALGGAALAGYDAIVVGSRAYETEPALAEATGRLIDYARAGGLVLVLYQQYPWFEGGHPPYPLEIARPHDRVTDETASVAVLAPDSPVLHRPNEIGAADWEGWVQERGLYFARSWGPEWTPLLAMADPGQPEQRGGLLVARFGEGWFVYTGLAFFRQIPAGVPGAYRLFANLLALGEV